MVMFSLKYGTNHLENPGLEGGVGGKGDNNNNNKK